VWGKRVAEEGEATAQPQSNRWEELQEWEAQRVLAFEMLKQMKVNPKQREEGPSQGP